ncbi:methyltransferase [Conexibacter sp. JD483]|uniref:methyltransferase n=1 Tax=unclassified Conexibacter TaxID=2627773 RepID=UPI002720F97A|nr:MULTISPECIES: methyltransferase [unclassified Conexibacter]MDO8187872.1 methyltransferase [Conexibacter sp. CPCC 205706]MDO8201224.1 methyltransferase [Conexibacter sp. CPCC 205762]MDR9369764.1 methyltransferase [Conexibacter sp. JD483]
MTATAEITGAGALSAPAPEAAPLLGALLAGAGLGMLDPLARRGAHLQQPFWDPHAAAEAARGLDPLAATVLRLWCGGETLSEGELTATLDEETVGELLAAGLVVRGDDGIAAPWRIATVLQRHLLVTPPAHDEAFDLRAPVAYLGPESLFLAPFVAGMRPAARALDLCAGAGLQALLAPAAEVVAVELDPFAAAVARFNAILNDRPLDVREGSLLAPVAGERFDLVVANPPFLPAPAGVALPRCGDGGVTGDDVLRELVAGLPGVLAEGGRALVYGEDLGLLDEPHVASWLREQGAWPGHDLTLHVTHTRYNERTALRLTELWRACGASEQEAWDAWRELGALRPSTHHHSFLIEVGPGSGRVLVRRTPRVA